MQAPDSCGSSARLQSRHRVHVHCPHQAILGHHSAACSDFNCESTHPTNSPPKPHTTSPVQEPDFDPEWIAASAPAPPASPSPAPQQQRQAPPPTTAAAPPPRAAASAYPRAGGLNRISVFVFGLQLFMILVGVLHFIPFFPFSRIAYIYFMRAALACQLLKLYAANGMPNFKPMTNAMVGCWGLGATLDL